MTQHTPRRLAGASAPKTGHLRYVSPAELRAIFGDDPIDRWAAERIQAEPEVRRINWPRIVEAFCIASAVFALAWFGGLELLAVFQ